MLAGLILGSPTLRLRGDYLAIVTLGFGEIIRLIADNLPTSPAARAASPSPVPAGESESCPTASSQRGTPRVDANYAPVSGSACILIVVILLAGRQPRAQPGRPGLGGDPGGRGRRRADGRAHVQVQAVGVRDRRRDRRPGRRALRRPGEFVDPPTFIFIISILFLCAVVLGGPGNMLGVILGAFISSTCRTGCRVCEFLGINLGDLKYLFFGLALMVMMIFRPQGLFPARQQLLAYGQGRRASCCASGSASRSRPHDSRRQERRGRSRNSPVTIARFTPPRASPRQTKV